MAHDKTQYRVETVPYAAVGAYAFEAEHNFTKWEDPEVLDEHAEETWRAFEALDPVRAGEDLTKVLRAVAQSPCLGCREVAIRIRMLIEDLGDQY